MRKSRMHRYLVPCTISRWHLLDLRGKDKTAIDARRLNMVSIRSMSVKTDPNDLFSRPVPMRWQ